MPNGKIGYIVFPKLVMASISSAFRNEDEEEFLSFGYEGREKGKVGFRVAVHVLMN
jgi:hypothetical protein